MAILARHGGGGTQIAHAIYNVVHDSYGTAPRLFITEMDNIGAGFGGTTSTVGPTSWDPTTRTLTILLGGWPGGTFSTSVATYVQDAGGAVSVTVFGARGAGRPTLRTRLPPSEAPTRLRLAMPPRARLALLAASLLASACNFGQAGIDPPPGVLNFPIAAALSRSDPAGPADRLVVVNSNFDLRFNTGSVQVFDLAGLDAQIDACGGSGEDCVIDGDAFEGLLLSEVGVGSHAAGLAFGSSGSRLYLPVRREQDLTWIDFNDGGLGCGAERRDPESTEPDIPRCDAAHRVGRRESIASERALDLGGDPVAVAVIPGRDLGADVGDFVLMPLRDGRVALFLDDGRGPELIHVARGFPENIVTITPQPGAGIAWMTAVGTDEISRVGVIVDEASPTRSFLYDAGALRLGGIDDGEDTRDFQFHPTRPDTAFVLSRRPEAVVEVDLERRGLTSRDLGLRDVFEVGQGPSRLLPIDVDGRTYVLASCFGAQRLFVIDVDSGALVSVVGGLSGPFEIAVDPVRERLYVVDFIVSVIRVIDLSPLRTGGVPTLIATLGKPNPPRTLID